MNRRSRLLVSLVAAPSLACTCATAPAVAQEPQPMALSSDGAFKALNIQDLLRPNPNQNAALAQALGVFAALGAGIGVLALLLTTGGGSSSRTTTAPTPAPSPSTAQQPTTSTVIPTPSSKTNPDSFAGRVEALKRLVAADTTGNTALGWIAPGGPQLVTPTHDGSGQATHPSVVYDENGWNGYKYWMAMTPYPANNEAHEDPNILASNDGTTWVVPEGLTNPIDDQLGKPNPHNSDAQLQFGPDGNLVLTWRKVDRLHHKKNKIYVATSSDGVHWSEPVQIWEGDRNTENSVLLSQALIWTGSQWRLYGVQYHDDHNDLVYWESKTNDLAINNWNGPIINEVTPAADADRRFWHVDVQRYGDEYLGLMMDAPLQATTDGNLYFIRSTDGLHWDRSPVPLIAHADAGYANLYKSTFVPRGQGTDLTLELFYAGYTSKKPTVWHINKTAATHVGTSSAEN
ncbi:hypothetical protein [uncultured Corynebacterium sp.]|uniref:hypothetical protein n=1 Tax=uncultured Corynebacterium sp. TaxID=159447 RepID=UPI0025E04C7A|nr:hypothetical protein [uncultured Corynebacterium sp.]